MFLQKLVWENVFFIISDLVFIHILSIVEQYWRKRAKMPKPKDTRSKYVHWLIGQATDVLRNDFVERVSRGDQIDMSSSRPFSGPLMLPTKGECLKLWWFLKDSDGRHNGQSLLTGTITGKVVATISQYWRMAGYENEAEDWKMNDGTKYRLVSEIVKRYQNLMKSRSSKSEKSLL